MGLTGCWVFAYEDLSHPWLLPVGGVGLCVCGVGLMGLFPRLRLHDRWAGSRIEFEPNSGLRWSASHGSPPMGPLLQM